MKVNDFIKYKNFVENNDFHTRYKTTKNFLLIFSWVGTLLLTFFGYFLIYDLLFPVINNYVPNKDYTIVITSVISLVLIVTFEWVKRSYINNFSYSYVKDANKINSNDTKVNLSFVIILVTLSTVLSVNGVARFSNTNDSLDIKTENTIDFYKDSLENKIYNPKILDIEKEIELLSESNKNTISKIDGTANIWVKKKLKDEIDFNDKRIGKLKKNITDLKSEKDSLIREEKSRLELKNDKIKTNTSSTSKYFKFISILFEIFVFVGIYFSVVFNYKSYNDNLHKFDKKLKEFNDKKVMLDILYMNGKVNIGDAVMSMTELYEKIKMSDNINTTKSVSDEFYKDLDRLKVIKINSNHDKEFLVDYDDALKVLNEMVQL